MAKWIPWDGEAGKGVLDRRIGIYRGSEARKELHELRETKKARAPEM